MHTIVIFIFLLLALPVAANADKDAFVNNMPSETQPIKSEIYHKKGHSLLNSHIKFEHQKKGTVAFLGGSITEGGGWREHICEYLQQRFPDTDFTFINAGISSLGSTPGAFRLSRDVLSKGSIDLLFEEAAVNDVVSGRTDKEQIRGMEGIIRHMLIADSTTDIIVMNFVDPEKIASYNRGEIPAVIENFDKVSDHYDINTINLAKEVTDRINNKEFTWEDDFIDIHPSPFGHQIYANSIITFLENEFARDLTDADKITAHTVPEPYDPFCYANGVIIPFDDTTELSGFKKVTAWAPPIKVPTRKGYVDVDMLVGDKPGDSLTFSFQGRAVGLMVAAGPDAGMIEFSIDGEDYKKVDLFTPWSPGLYLPFYRTLYAELDNEKHVLQITVSEEKNPTSQGHSCIIKAFYVNK